MAKKQIIDYTFLPAFAPSANAYPNAYNRLVNNKNYITKMASAFIANQVANNTAPFVNFTYNAEKCERDVGYVLDAIINDLRYGGDADTVLVGSFYWFEGIPQVDGDRQPEVVTQNYIRDLINNYIFTGTAASPAYQTVVPQSTTGSNAEAGASGRITTLYATLTNIISTGVVPAATANPNYKGTVEILGNIPIKELLLIINVTRNIIIYNFADTTKGGQSIYNFNTKRTRYRLDFDTSSMIATDKLIIYVERDNETIKPHPTYQDPVEKMRVSTPQALMDTDFEYSLQGTKWETLTLMSNVPSVYSKANEPSFTAQQINSILPVPGGGPAAAVSYITYAPNGTTGLTLLRNGAYYADDYNEPLNFPWTVQFLGDNYSLAYFGSNGYFTFGSGSNQYSGYNQFAPPRGIGYAPADRTLWQFWYGLVNSNLFIVKISGGNCCSGPQVYDTEMHFNRLTPSIIDIHMVYKNTGDSVSPWVKTDSAYLFQGGLATGQAWRVVTGAGTSRDVTLNVNTTPPTPFYVGQPIIFKETQNLYLDGSYLVKTVVSNTQVTIGTGKALTAGFDYKSNYTTVYTGGFFTGAELPLNFVQTISGTLNADIFFNSPHALYPGQTIYVVDSTQNNADWVGSFQIFQVVSSTQVRFITARLTNWPSTATVSGANTRVYVRPTGVANHRFADGGVSISPGGSAPNTQIIRQTRKYFRYQSGKGIQFSTGVLFLPTYDINSVSVTTNVYSVSNPFYDLNILCDQEHGFAQPDSFRQGAYILLSGFTVSTGPNFYNGLYYVSGIASERQFTVKINPAITDLNPGGIAKVSVVSWYDCTIRDGLFDDQNGIFFEHDGQQLAVVKRASTQQLTGTVNVTNNSSTITGNGTKFLTQLSVGNYIVIKGMSYLITSKPSNTSATIAPDFRGITESNLRILKTIDDRTLQSNFNLDRMDGTGPSGYVFDKNKMQMVFIDYSWYGAGKIRWGMRGLDGSILYCHEAPQNNRNTEAYMRSGNLPGRFEINTTAKIGLLTSNLTTVSTSFTMGAADATQFPLTGRVVINYEVIRYTKGNTNSGQTTFNINLRNEYGLASNATGTAGIDSVISFNQNCGPSLSHWGVSVMMDGMFDSDKSYLFTAPTNNVISIPSSTELPLVSIRLAPSVDNGIGREFGVRNLINRSAIILRSIGVGCNGQFILSVRINSESTLFSTQANWRVVANGSISQYLDHSITGTSPVPTAGDTVFSFLAEAGSGGAQAVTTVNIDEIRELGNSTIGGQNVYPDGPDVLTLFARNLGGASANIRGRISWTESQG